MSTEVNLIDNERIKAAIAAIKGTVDPTDWLVLSYVEGKQNDIEFTASGSDGIQGLLSHLDVTKRQYALLRVVDFVDGYKTFKFVFIAWAGDKVPVVKKARMATHKGSIVNFVGQVHLSIDASTQDDCNESVIMGRVSDNSGSGNKVREARERLPEEIYHPPAPSQIVAPEPASEAAAPTPGEHGLYRGGGGGFSNPTKATKLGGAIHPGAARECKEVHFPDLDSIKAALNAVRSDSDPTNWAMLGYDGTTDNIVLLGKGEGDLEEIRSHLEPNSISYTLYRTQDRYDVTINTKFVFINWIGDGVKLQRKARVATHSGAIKDVVGSYHVDINASNDNEVTNEIVIAAVQKASGTANYVK